MFVFQGVLTKLNVSSNELFATGGKALAEALSGNQVLTELNLADSSLGLGGMSGVIAISNTIPTMGALMSLNLSKNALGAEGAKYVAEAVKDHVSGLLYSIGSISTGSDILFNCCCLWICLL